MSFEMESERNQNFQWLRDISVDPSTSKSAISSMLSPLGAIDYPPYSGFLQFQPSISMKAVEDTSSQQEQETTNDISELSLKLHLSSTDPEKWRKKDYLKWIRWQVHVNRLDFPRNYQTSGKQNPDLFPDILRGDEFYFKDKFGSELGVRLYHQLEAWRRYGKKRQYHVIRHPKCSKTTRANRGLYLWQLIIRLLMEPKVYGSCIRWRQEKEGEFEILDSQKVAEMWGGTKQNGKMNYEKLSRSLRQYYSRGMMYKPGPRLVYRINLNDVSVANFFERCRQQLPEIPQPSEYLDEDIKEEEDCDTDFETLP